MLCLRVQHSMCFLSASTFYSEDLAKAGGTWPERSQDPASLGVRLISVPALASNEELGLLEGRAFPEEAGANGLAASPLSRH